MKNNFLLISFLLVFLVPLVTNGQSKVKGLPENLNRPKDFFENGTQENQLYENTTNKDRTRPWIVISDRDFNPVYENKSTKSGVVRQIKFKEMFYVVDEDRGWIKIATANGVNKLKSKSIQTIGWVPKNRMLLWKSGLVDSRTGINKKAFLLNKSTNLKSFLPQGNGVDKLLVNFYRDPNAQYKEVERSIYNYYFVLKKENGMYLLAEESELTSFNIQTKLLGWVDQRRIQEWNTRISLEPNFDKPAFSERYINPEMVFRAFGKESEVMQYIKTGQYDNAYWDKDPVKLDPATMAKSNPRRFKGNVLRFPMFKKGEFGGVPFFQSGVIGSIKVLSKNKGGFEVKSEIPDLVWGALKDKVREQNDKMQNINLFFVIEGTDRTYAFQQKIVEAVREVSNNKFLQQATNVKYGALIYRDVPEGERTTEYSKLSSDLDRTCSFISQSSFSNKIDQDFSTAMYHGLKKSLQIAGFPDPQKNPAVNVVVLIGSCGDFFADEGRRKLAEKNNTPELITNKDPIYKNLSSINAHLHSIQLYHDGIRETGTAYGFQSYSLILNTAKYIYNKNVSNKQLKILLQQTNGLDYVEPNMEIPISKTKVSLEGGKPGILILPEKYQQLNDRQISSGLKEVVERSLVYEDVIRNGFVAIFNGGEDLEGAGKWIEENGLEIPEWTSAFVEGMSDIISDPELAKYIIPSTGMKLSLYSEVFLPLKAKNAYHPMYSFVLFMPENDLLEYQLMIERKLAIISASGTYPEKRQSLFEIYTGLVQQFAGEDYLKDKSPKDFTREQVLEIIQGIENEGLDLELELDVKIGDLLNEKIVSNADIDKLANRFAEVNTELEKVIKLTDRYDFCMVSDDSNRYYWLRLDQVF